MKVRRLGKANRRMLETAVRRVLGLERSATYPGPGAGHLARALADRRCYFLVGIVDSGPVGFLSAYRFPSVQGDGFLVYLYDLAVRPEHRRHGVAARLVEALKQQCRRDGVTRIWVGTALENKAARRTFEATGASRVTEAYVEYVYDL